MWPRSEPSITDRTEPFVTRLFVFPSRWNPVKVLDHTPLNSRHIISWNSLTSSVKYSGKRFPIHRCINWGSHIVSDTRQNNLASNPGLLNPKSVSSFLDLRNLLKIWLLWIVVHQGQDLLPYSYLQHLKALSLISRVPAIAFTDSAGNSGLLNSPLQDHWPSILPLSQLFKLYAFSSLAFILLFPLDPLETPLHAT